MTGMHYAWPITIEVHSTVVVDHFYTALVSALEQTHCTVVTCDSEWVTASKWCTYSTIWLLHGWCHVRLLLSWHMFCVHHITMHEFTVSFFAKPHMYLCLLFFNLCDFLTSIIILITIWIYKILPKYSHLWKLLLQIPQSASAWELGLVLMSESIPFSSVLYICLFSYCSSCWSKGNEWYTYFNPEKKNLIILSSIWLWVLLSMPSLKQFFAEGFC